MRSRFAPLEIVTSIFSWLPLRILYVKSSALAWLANYIIRYRRQIVSQNLSRSFPDATEKEIAGWRRKFYHNLADILVEIVRMKGISRSEIPKRVEFINPEIFDSLYDEGKSAIIVSGHRGNWEWSGVFLPTVLKHKVAAVYKPLSNKAFDLLMKNTRERFGLELLPMRSVARHIAANKDPWVRIFASDQSPTAHDIQHYMDFLGQDTPVYTGPGKIAKASGHAVIFMDMHRVSRGHYTVHFQAVRPESGTSDEFLTTEAYNRMLEEGIRREPDNWLWSHRRWKHSRRADTQA